MNLDRVPWDSEWKPIPLFPGYWLSQHGQVFNMKRGTVVATYFNQHNTKAVRMYASLTSSGARGYSRSVEKLLREVWP